MLGVAIAPELTGYRFFFPRDAADWIGTFAAIAGTAIVVATIAVLKKDLTASPDVKPGTRLATEFPFSHSRNPIYVGGIVMCLSWSLLQRSWMAFFLTILLAVVLHFKIKIEEYHLELFFGKEYLQYKARVRRYF